MCNGVCSYQLVVMPSSPSIFSTSNLLHTSHLPHLEGELIEWVDLVEVIQDEVEQGGASGSWAVALSGFIDLLLCHLSLCHL